jgi:hypothetical protein
MFLIIAIRKSFRNVVLAPFLEFFSQKHKFETWFEKFFKGNFEVILFLVFLSRN